MVSTPFKTMHLVWVDEVNDDILFSCYSKLGSTRTRLMCYRLAIFNAARTSCSTTMALLCRLNKSYILYSSAKHGQN